MTVIRVFPIRTSLTPTDEFAFVGDPPLMRPAADRVDVSCTFTWDKPEAERLAASWAQYYPVVQLGGPAYGAKPNGFVPGMYVKQGVTFTSRGCPNACPWCLVPSREGKLQEYSDVCAGHIINDNNFLACQPEHRARVYQMLNKQGKAAIFSGGLQASLVTDQVAEELRGVRIEQLFLAADTEGSLKPLASALGRLAFLGRRKLRVYTLLAFGGETIPQATSRLERVWELGGMPHAQLYQPIGEKIEYSDEWRKLARTWSRPAAMFAAHKVSVLGE